MKEMKERDRGGKMRLRNLEEEEGGREGREGKEGKEGGKNGKDEGCGRSEVIK